MSLLTIVQKVATRVGITKPTAVMSSSDQKILQIKDLIEQDGEELVERNQWEALVNEATFVTLAQQSQGAVETISPNLSRIINKTFWNRTLQRPVYGPMTRQEWSEAIASSATGPWNSYIIQGGEVLFHSAPTVGETCAYYYISKNFVNLDAGGTSDTFAEDADTTVFPEKILIAGGIWRWKAAKGFDYAEDFNAYERMVLDIMGRDGTAPVLSLSGKPYSVTASILVPAGNWNQ